MIMLLRAFGRAAAWLLMVLAFLAALTMVAATTVYAAPQPADPAAIHAEELQGFLPNQNDTHFLGLESAGAAKQIVLTLHSWTPEGLPAAEALNFVVLTEAGLHAVLAGTAPQDAAIATGKLLRSPAAEGVVAQAIVPAGLASGYTVVVSNPSDVPVSYVLAVKGGVLIDEAGQTQPAQAPGWPDAPALLVASYAQSATFTEEQVIQAAPASAQETGRATGKGAVTAYRISGSLYQLYDRHFLDLIPLQPDAEITVRLTVDTGFQPVAGGKINFWVLTQSGLRQVMQGALPKELNLATGQAVAGGQVGEMQATLRIGGETPYTLIVFNDSATPAAYTLHVEGALLADTFGQTNEAKAAVAEEAVVATQPAPATMFLRRPE